MLKLSIKEILSTKYPLGTEVLVNGWVRTRRDSKLGLSFINLNDGSTFSNLQVVAVNSLNNYNEQILNLTKDAAIEVTGELVASEGGAQAIELKAKTIKVYGFVENPDTYPISPKKHTVEYLREHQHLRVRTNLISSVMRLRNTVSFAIHQFLQQEGFYWVHTPIITTADAEGAGELFRVTNLDLNNLPKENGKVNFKEDFFAKESFLTVSGQLNVESYALSLSKVYTFGPTFRAENSNTTRHLAEFWMVEPEFAFVDLQDNYILAERLIKHVFKTVFEKNPLEMEFFNQFIDQDVISRLERMVNDDFEVITYTEAISKLEQSKQKFENSLYWGVDLSSEHERYLCESLIGKPTIVTNYPKDIKAFYMRQNEDGKTVAAMDILAPGIGEIVGGSAREERYDRLVARMQELNMDFKNLAWYLDLRRFGTAPHAGFGVGLERLISYITGVNNIRDIIPFPRAPKFAEY